MSFKSYLEQDLGTFINVDEFGDTVDFNGQAVVAVVDNSVANSFEKAQLQGVFKQTTVVYLKQGDLDPLPMVGEDVRLNGLHFTCRDVQYEMGVDILTLEAYEQ